MTIKRRLFFSNIRMVLITIGGSVITFLAVRILFFIIMGGTWWNGTENYSNLERYNTRGWGSLFLLVSIAVFVLFISIINSILTYRMIKNITKPLEILTRGVNQIQDKNFAHRIEYTDDDEFRPVCEAFNQMASQLEASTERRLKDEANRRELLAGISHDLRTPLTTINGYLDGLESGVASTPEMREKYFNTIKNKTLDMKHIIEQLFLFSKLDMDEFPFSPARFDLTRALSDMVEELTEEYAMRGLEIVINTGPQNVFVHADVSQFRRVVINILENSVKYKEKETGRMEISSSLDKNFAQIKFADNGPGVSHDMLPNLFNAFYRADPSRHTKGSGLGLAISAKIIERSGGTIHAENAGTGGLVIVICLPVETGEV
jgi:signal transduction histidine kinase